MRGEPSVKRDWRRGRVFGVIVAIEGVGDAILMVVRSVDSVRVLMRCDATGTDVWDR